MIRHHALLGLALLVGLLDSPTAHADETDACFSAPVEGQKLRNEGKLQAALTRFETCRAQGCPAEIVADCTRWAGAVDAAIPSIVIAARDAKDHDLLDVRVTIDDGAPLAVTARAIVLDPGPHKLVLSRQGAEAVEQDILLREGEKNRVIVVRLEPAPPPPAEAAPAPVPSTVSTRPVPGAVWATLAVGGVALGSFAVVAGLGISERASDGCATGCTSAQKADVDLKFHFADALLAVSIVSLAIGAIVYFTRPTVTHAAPSLAFQF